MATRKETEKSVDLPPTGASNPDPITDAPGAHPIETGIGAALGGVAAGAAIGTVAGPVGTAIGAALGAVAGGYAGKGVGELIDPTSEDAWLRASFPSRSYVERGETYETYKPAYHYAGDSETKLAGRPFHEVEQDLKAGWDKTKHAADVGWDKAKHAVKDVFDYRSARRYGGEAHEQYGDRPFHEVEGELSAGWAKSKHAASLTWDKAKDAVKDAFDTRSRHRYAEEAHDKYGGRPFAEVENDLKAGWEKTKHAAATTWDRAKDTVRDAYDKTIQLREERLKVDKKPVETGDVSIRKEVVTENKSITVPVEREEIVIEHRPASGRAVEGAISDVGAEEIRIPVRREEIEVGKESVVTDEIHVGKRKVQGSEQASGTVKREQLKVDEHGDVEVRDLDRDKKRR